MAKALSRSHAPEPFGARLRRLRAARGLTQLELGEAVDLSQRMMAYYEAQGGTPSGPLVAKLAKALRVSADEIVGVKAGAAPIDIPSTASELRLWRRVRLLDKLSPADRRSIVRQIEALARDAGVEVDDDEAS